MRENEGTEAKAESIKKSLWECVSNHVNVTKLEGTNYAGVVSVHWKVKLKNCPKLPEANEELELYSV